MCPRVRVMSISPREAILVLSSARRASWLLGRIGIFSWVTMFSLMKETVAPVSRVMLTGVSLWKRVRIWLGMGVSLLRVGEGSKLRRRRRGRKAAQRTGGRSRTK